MTILPKKKPTKEKTEGGNSGVDPLSSVHSHSLSHPPAGSDVRHDGHRVSGRRPNSPPQGWGSPPPVEDRGLPAHDVGGARFDDFGHDSSSAHNKRRHRSSPHRNVRKHRWDGSLPSTSTHSHSHTSRRHASYRHERPSTSKDLSSSPLEDLGQGYNSEDENEPREYPDDIEELELCFEKVLKDKRGFTIKKMGEDGACMFRAVADQIFGDQEMHSVVRQNCIDYMVKNGDFFSQYITEDFQTYINRKRLASCHGNHVEIQALCELYNRPIEVYQYRVEPINTFHGAYETDNEPIRLSYHKNIHYNSVVDPYKATVGVGLGLPGHQPGQADKNLMQSATKQSEDFHIEKTMLEDKLRETDWEVTQETIEEQVARESYLQWLRDQERQAKRQTSPKGTASATCSSASASHQCFWDGGDTSSSKSPEPRSARSPRNRSAPSSGQNSPHQTDQAPPQTMDSTPSPPQPDLQQGQLQGVPVPAASPSPQALGAESVQGSHPLEGAVGGAGFQETTSLMNDLPLQMYGLSEWGEDDVLAQVMAQSQQEYLDNLRRQAIATPPGESNDIPCPALPPPPPPPPPLPSSAAAGSSARVHPPAERGAVVGMETGTGAPEDSVARHVAQQLQPPTSRHPHPHGKDSTMNRKKGKRQDR